MPNKHNYTRLGNPAARIGQLAVALAGPLSEAGSQSAAAVEGVRNRLTKPPSSDK